MQEISVPGRIVAMKRNKKTYYSYIRTSRVKIDPENKGKGRGSGKSKIVTESIYLGTAEDIREKLSKEVPLEIHKKSFGLPCALWEMCKRIHLVEIVNEVINKDQKNRRVSLGEYVALAAINQVGHTASKRGLSSWYESTVLPRITGISKENLSSQHFWNAFDEIVSERDLDKRKQESGIEAGEKVSFEQLEKLLDDKNIEEIEKQLWKVISKKLGLLLDVILYDGSNFYNFMSDDNPGNIAQKSKSNKQNRYDKRQVGLALAVLRHGGLPLFHILYGGQTNEQRLFTTAISTLVNRCAEIGQCAQKMVLVFDQGSNSQKHFDFLKDKVHFIGSLSPSNYPTLVNVPLSKYSGIHGKVQFYSTKMQIYERECLAVMTFSKKRQLKERLKFNKQLKHIRSSLNSKIKKHYNSDLDSLSEEIRQSLDSQKILKSKASRYLELKDYKNGGGKRSLSVVSKKLMVTKRYLTFGKSIIFTDMLHEKPETILDDYHCKQTVENSFKTLKDRQYVSFWPMFHWTDTKIRVHAFVTILGFLLIKLVEYQVRSQGLQISGKALVNELQDITETLLLYSPQQAERKICQMNTNQEELFNTLSLSQFV